MFRIYTVRAGHEIRIDTFGVATNTTPAIVPDHVADELRDREDLRIEDGGGYAHVPATDNGDKAAMEIETEE